MSSFKGELCRPDVNSCLCGICIYRNSSDRPEGCYGKGSCMDCNPEDNTADDYYGIRECKSFKSEYANKILNEDGTTMDNFPENPLKEKWDKLYPPTPKPEHSQACDGYSCMWCDRCPKGSNWKVPEEDKEIYKEYQKQIIEYHKIHNPSLFTLNEPSNTFMNYLKIKMEEIKI